MELNAFRILVSAPGYLMENLKIYAIENVFGYSKRHKYTSIKTY